MTTAWKIRCSKGTTGPQEKEDFWIPSGRRGVGAEHLRKLTYFLNKNEQQTSLLPSSFSFFSSTFPTHTHFFFSYMSYMDLAVGTIQTCKNAVHGQQKTF